MYSKFMDSPGHLINTRGLISYLLALLFLVAPATALSKDLVRACFVEWPPYTMATEHGADGISVRIMKRAANLLGTKIEFVQMTWSACLKKVEEGQLDVVLDAARRGNFLQGPTSFSLYSDTFWVRDQTNITRYEQLSGGTVALVDGYVYDERLYSHINDLGLEIVMGANELEIVQDLVQGKVGSAVADLASTYIVVREKNLKAQPILPPFSFERLYASFHRDQTGLQREFDRAFAQLIDQGYVDEIYRAAIGTDFSSFIAGE